MAQQIKGQRSNISQDSGEKRKGEQPSNEVIHAGQGTPLDPLLQVGDLSMSTGWSREHETFYWSCIYGCRGYDYEGHWEAEQAFLAHTCRSAGKAQ